MYSGLGGVRATVTTRAGLEADVDVDDYTAYMRSEINWGRYLPQHLCAVYPDAKSVFVAQGGDAVSRAC